MRLVIKVGTQVICGKFALNRTRLGQIIGEIATLIKHGHEVVLVSSGAIGAGLPYVHFNEEERKKKVAAAVGQPLLMHSYINAAHKSHIAVGQILILADDFTNKKHFKNFVLNVNSMLSHKILPIINENDVMKKEDLSVGDNDNFSARIAVGLKADKLVILTNQDGFFTDNPDKDKNAKLIKEVAKVNLKIENLCTLDKSKFGRGGMPAKIQAAKYATERGVETLIGNGEKEGTIKAAMGDNFPGTRFAAQIKTQAKKKK